MPTLKSRWQTRLRQTTNGLVAMTALAIPISTSAADLLFPLAGVLALASQSWRSQWRTLFTHPIRLLLLAFFLCYVVAITYTIAPSHEIIHRFLKVSCLLIAAILIGLTITERWQRIAINAFLLSMLATLVLSYAKYYFFPNMAFHTHFDRSSVFKDHIIQNYLMAFATMLFAYRWIKHEPFRWFYGLVTLLGTYNVLFMSAGRSGYVVFAVLLLFAAFRQYRLRGLLLASTFLVMLCGAAYLSSPDFHHRLRSVTTETHQYNTGKADTSVGVRLASMKNAYLLFLQKPWLGHGTGSFKAAYATLPTNTVGSAGLVPISYNSYLNVGVELGIMGLIILAALFILQWRFSFFLPDQTAYLIQILLLGMAVGCLANPWLSDTTELHLYALFSALVFSGLPRRYFLRLTAASRNASAMNEGDIA